jgi:hypothetical protein
VILYYCSLSPDFICHYPGLNLTRVSSGHYFTSFIPEYENGTTLGYHFEIEYEKSKQIVPESEMFDNYSNIIKASDNQFYFSILLIETKRSSSNVSFIPLWLSTAELMLMIPLFMRRKNRMK